MLKPGAGCDDEPYDGGQCILGSACGSLSRDCILNALRLIACGWSGERLKDADEAERWGDIEEMVVVVGIVVV